MADFFVRILIIGRIRGLKGYLESMMGFFEVGRLAMGSGTENSREVGKEWVVEVKSQACECAAFGARASTGLGERGWG